MTDCIWPIKPIIIWPVKEFGQPFSVLKMDWRNRCTHVPWLTRPREDAPWTTAPLLLPLTVDRPPTAPPWGVRAMMPSMKSPQSKYWLRVAIGVQSRAWHTSRRVCNDLLPIFWSFLVITSSAYILVNWAWLRANSQFNVTETPKEEHYQPTDKGLGISSTLLKL